MSDAPENDNLERFLNEKCVKIHIFVFS